VVGAAESHPMETFVEAAFDIAETPSSPQSSLEARNAGIVVHFRIKKPSALRK
jgi:hypothetical protein